MAEPLGDKPTPPPAPLHPPQQEVIDVRPSTHPMIRLEQEEKWLESLVPGSPRARALADCAALNQTQVDHDGSIVTLTELNGRLHAFEKGQLKLDKYEEATLRKNIEEYRTHMIPGAQRNLAKQRKDVEEAKNDPKLGHEYRAGFTYWEERLLFDLIRGYQEAGHDLPTAKYMATRGMSGLARKFKTRHQEPKK